MASATIDGGIPTVVASETLGELKESTVMAALARRDFDTEVAEFGQTITLQKRNAFTVVQINDMPTDSNPTDTDIATFDQPGDTTVSITLDQHWGIPFSIGDVHKAFNKPNVENDFIKDAAIVLARKIDTTGLTTVEDNAGTTVYTNGFTAASDGTDVLVQDLIDADKTMSVNKAPMQQRYAVWHPRAKAKLLAKGIFIGHEITANLALSVPGDMVGASLRDAVLARRMGFEHYMDQNVGVDGGHSSSTGSGNQANIFFQRSGVVLATRPLPEPANVPSSVMSEDGLALRVSIAWNIKRARNEVLLDFLWGWKVIRTEFAIRATSILSS